MLSVTRLQWNPADTAVLRGVDLELSPGGLVSLLGQSGCGKTTLLRMIMGLQAPDAGEIRWQDQPLTSGTRLVVPAAKRPFSYLFQDFTLFPHVNVRKNILLGIRDLPKPERRGRLEEMCALLDIGHLLPRMVYDLSGGEQQRVALARTLVMRPRLLLLDEPFSNMDGMRKTGLYGDVKQIIRDAGMSAILATHDRAEAFFFGDRLVVMADGRVVANDPPVDVYRHPQTAWLARFTGEANLLDAEQLATLGKPVTGEGQWLVRPEDIHLRGGGTDAVVKSVEFYGEVTKVNVETTSGISLRVHAAGLCEWQPDQAVGLTWLRNPVPVNA